jgi:hypothetical protein
MKPQPRATRSKPAGAWLYLVQQRQGQRWHGIAYEPAHADAARRAATLHALGRAARVVRQWSGVTP